MRAPTLAEVLTNQAPPPYTLSAFMAFLSHNHCLETLEFTLDASRYQTYYYSLEIIPPIPGSDEANRLRSSWDRLINAYIRPGAPREVNLAASDRDSLMRIPNTYTPPPPEALDCAVYKITELMRESVLSPFLQSCQAKLNQEQGFHSDVSTNYYQYGHQTAHYPPSHTIPRQQHNSSNKRQLQNVTMQARQPILPNHSMQFSSQSDFHQNAQTSQLTQMFGQSTDRRIQRPPSTTPTSVPSTDFPLGMDTWAQQSDSGQTEDTDMSGSEDPITPPHTPPTSMSPTSGGGQWRSKIKNQFSRMNGNRAKSREAN